MNFKVYNRSQNLLLPPSFSDFLGESHEAVVLCELLGELDLSCLEEGYTNGSGGRSAYHPSMLLSVLLYGYMNGVFSSRKIAGKLKQDLAFMYLAGKQTPDFRTLCRFRREKGACLEDVFKTIVDKARRLGFVAFGTVSLDGTKLKANANKEKNETQDSLEEKIRKLMEEAERIDAMEDELLGDQEDDVDPQLKTKEGRAKRKRELEKKREQTSSHLKQRPASEPGVSKDTKLNTTDPDSKLMKMKRGGFANGYNVQIISENGFVLASHIAGTSADQNLLIPTLQAFRDAHRTNPTRLLADKGYSSEDNFAFCESEGIDAYIPIHQDPLDLSVYTYDPEHDAYAHQDGRIFRFKQRMKKRKGDTQIDGQDYRHTIYEHIDETTKKKSYLCISPNWQRLAAKHKRRLAAPEGKERYKKRMPDVEGVFGNIKHNLGFTGFLLRGLTGARIEWNMITLAHNLKKLI
ncbi:IS1182 family transposase [Patescibacteria group bacterium]|nr:IS1182 family transposase [Patescibacteria group bacterium]